MNIAIVDYGMGNLHSAYKAVQKVALNARVELVDTPEKIQAADRIILPGQGAIAACMAAIRSKHLLAALKDAAKNKPFLGICIGPQLMSCHSTENNGVDGIGLLDCETVRFNPDGEDCGEKIKIPQMGWNQIKQNREHFLWNGISDNSFFYFVHSYHLTDNDFSIGTCSYGETFPAAVAKDNIAGLQAHPEKSGENGLRFLANFVAWQP